MRRLLALVATVALIGAALWFRERREGDDTAGTGGADRGGGARRAPGSSAPPNCGRRASRRPRPCRD